MRVCIRVADIIEREIVALLERFTTVTQTVCRTVVREIEEWHRRWERIIVAAITGIPEFLSCLVGLRIASNLGICVTVLADVGTGDPVVDDATVTRTIEGAARIILERTNVRCASTTGA